MPILFGAFVFALTVGIIGVEVRRKEYATLLALGVEPRRIRRSVAGEGILFGTVVCILTVASAVAVGGPPALGGRFPWHSPAVSSWRLPWCQLPGQSDAWSRSLPFGMRLPGSQGHSRQ